MIVLSKHSSCAPPSVPAVDQPGGNEFHAETGVHMELWVYFTAELEQKHKGMPKGGYLQGSHSVTPCSYFV